jgi:hypothetical protein
MKEPSMMMLRYFAAALALIFSLGLPGCGPFKSEKVALCQEAMKMNADQLKAGEEARNNLVNRCSTQAGIYTLDQWKCIVAEMKQGKSYTEAGNTCESK